MIGKTNALTLSGGGDIDHGGKYLVCVVDYDGTVLKQDHLDSGSTFTLPNAPVHTTPVDLTFVTWSCPVVITDNTITVTDSDIIIGPTYRTTSGLSEFVIEVNKATSKTISLTWQETNPVDWGDGTTSASGSHTYAEYGTYIIKVDGIAGSSNYYPFGNSGTSTPNYYLKSAHTSANTFDFGVIFSYCYNLETITISGKSGSPTYFNSGFTDLPLLKCFIYPAGTQSLSASSLVNCYNVKYCVIPRSASKITGTPVISKCYKIENLSLTTTQRDNVSVSMTSGLVIDCYSLKKLTIPTNTNLIIYNNFFARNYAIMEYDFTRWSSIPTLNNINAFTGTNKFCKIIVPDGLYETWIASGNWATYADYIYKASEV